MSAVWLSQEAMPCNHPCDDDSISRANHFGSTSSGLRQLASIHHRRKPGSGSSTGARTTEVGWINADSSPWLIAFAVVSAALGLGCCILAIQGGLLDKRRLTRRNNTRRGSGKHSKSMRGDNASRASAASADQQATFDVGGNKEFLPAKQSVVQELERTAAEPLEYRRRHFKEMCLRHHPDKNGNSEESKAVFQFLQVQKQRYLPDGDDVPAAVTVGRESDGPATWV
eukprot:gnl/TRDRNA2_/TRDRNA2_203294_c0_seq1.p1 gnl/TRDRNA2_/TRDRNA2_203294_c0~~gnl/TRDRNA2_/TRDRNA2_203294_c0_seq1.p1  ORF type:complete len:227 (+),score=32.43 gnl/TRDRNA2_/TRDRNA2_203294_c0_seq1:100-780(+)